jgi:hypothetical protein
MRDVAQAVVVAMGQERSHGVIAPPFAAPALNLSGLRKHKWCVHPEEP